MISEDTTLKKLVEHDKRFDAIDKKLSKRDSLFDKNEEAHRAMIKKLLEHDDRFDEMQERIDHRFDDVMTGMDKILTIVQRLDQERLFTYERIKRIEDEICVHSKELKQIKKVLHIV